MDNSCRDVLKVVRRTLTPDQIRRSLVYWYKRVLKEGESISIGPETSTMPFEGTMVFVDLVPRANWAHPCLYLLVDRRTLGARVIEASIPPDVDQSDENYIIILEYGQVPPNECSSDKSGA